MEENTNFIIKFLAIILIAILAFTVYRNEMCQKELDALSDTVNKIQVRVDSLTSMVGQLDVLVGTANSPMNSPETRVPNQALTRTLSTPGMTSDTNLSASSNGSRLGRVSVNVKVKVENRYAKMADVPNVTIGPTGIVVIDVTIDQIGMVLSVAKNSASTITDEEIIDQCKDAALKTLLSYNPEAPQKTKGTITYTFTAK